MLASVQWTSYQLPLPPPPPPPNMSYPSQSVIADVFLPKEMVQDMFQWQGLVKTVMKFAVS